MQRNQKVKKFLLSPDIKLILVVFLVIAIGFLSLYIVSEFNYGVEKFISYPSSTIWILSDKFFSQDFKDKTTVFILGSSHIDSLDPYHIEGKLSEDDLLVDVYNLSIVADRPQHRISSVDKIVSAKPDLVIYGIGFRDFSKYVYVKGPEINDFSITDIEKILPDPRDIISRELKLDHYFYENFGHLKSPKLSTFILFENIQKHYVDNVNIPYEEYSEKIPFLEPSDEIQTIASKRELQNEIANNSWDGFEVSDYNFQQLSKIIGILHDNKIKVIIFTTPHSNEYLNMIPETDKQFFLSKLDDLNKDLDVPVYHFYDAYKDMDLWLDSRHVTVEKEGIIFSENIAELISKSI